MNTGQTTDREKLPVETYLLNTDERYQVSTYDLCTSSDCLGQDRSASRVVELHKPGNTETAAGTEVFAGVHVRKPRKDTQKIPRIAKSSGVIKEKRESPLYEEFISSPGPIEKMKQVTISKRPDSGRVPFDFDSSSPREDFSKNTVSAVDNAIGKLNGCGHEIYARLIIIQSEQTYYTAPEVYGKEVTTQEESVNHSRATLDEEMETVGDALVPPVQQAGYEVKAIDRDPGSVPNLAKPSIIDPQERAKAHLRYPDLRPESTGQAFLCEHAPRLGRIFNRNRGAVSKLPMEKTELKWYLGPSANDPEFNPRPEPAR